MVESNATAGDVTILFHSLTIHFNKTKKCCLKVTTNLVYQQTVSFYHRSALVKRQVKGASLNLLPIDLDLSLDD